jgi:glycosyltransferase involved in cell wall biosynthesis
VIAVPVTKEDSSKLLPIAIMAHNEEKVIQKAVESILSQDVPVGYSVKVVVVANGCSDRTEEIVKGLEERNPNKVALVSIKEKGKTRAINRAIKFFDEISSTDLQIPYVIFLDADCEFNGKEALIDFVNRFEQNPQLCAVGADCLPDVLFNKRKDVVAELYRTVYKLSKSVRINSISGMCYGIRLDVLKMVNFPEIQFAEDMFVSARLNGWFCKDRSIQIVFKAPSDFRNEIKRRIRQEISTQRYHQYYLYLKQQNERIKLFSHSLGKDFVWWGATDNGIIKKWLKMKGLKSKILSVIYVLIRLWAKIRVRSTLWRMRNNVKLDYWKVLR